MKKRNDGCGKQCYLPVEEKHIQCGSFPEDNPKEEYFLCHSCIKNQQVFKEQNINKEVKNGSN